MVKLFSILFLMTSLFLFCCTGGKNTATETAGDGALLLTFYNVENLFDTINDPATNDDEFTPASEKQWNTQRYLEKLDHLGKVLANVGTNLPDIIGLCEVENEAVVRDLASTDYLKSKSYKLVHRDSPDGRGIDVALLYDPEKLEVLTTEYIQSLLPAGDRPQTRLVLYATMKSGADTLHCFVNHWPSRSGGQEETEPNRLTVAYNVDKRVDAIRAENPDAQIVLMGDFNDYPNNRSLAEIMDAGLGENHALVNLMWDIHKSGLGTYNYKGSWGCLDQFLVSQSLLDSSKGFYVEGGAQIIKKDWMLFVDDKGVAYPSRTYGGPNYYGGFSDHLPIAMEIKHN